MIRISFRTYLNSSQKPFKAAFQGDFQDASVAQETSHPTRKIISIFRAQFPNFTPDRRYSMSYLPKAFNFTNSSTSKNKRLDRESTTSCRLGASLEKPGVTLKSARTMMNSGTYFSFINLVEKAIFKASSLSERSQSQSPLSCDLGVSHFPCVAGTALTPRVISKHSLDYTNLGTRFSHGSGTHFSFTNLVKKVASVFPFSLSERSTARLLSYCQDSRDLDTGSGFNTTTSIASFSLVTYLKKGCKNLSASSSSYKINTHLHLLLFAFMFFFASSETSASLSTPFTSKLTTLSSQLELIGKSIVGVSVLIGIILSATGNPQWKMIITAVCVGVAILGFTTIKQFIGL